jgi:hypothetical protein
MNDAMAAALAELTAALDRLGIRYAVGGSLASSAHGAFRATLDGDLIALITPRQARSLTDALGQSWYADQDTIERALGAGRAFNLIHMGSALKFDIFPATSDFHLTQLERAGVTQVLERINCVVTTAEDILLAKLRWYADGGEVSDRQWNDIVGLLATNESLDNEYVESWAARLGVRALLERARADAARE